MTLTLLHRKTFDVGDLPVLTYGKPPNCVLKTGVVKWPLKMHVRFLYFFVKIQKRDFLTFFALLHVFSRTLGVFHAAAGHWSVGVAS